MEYEVETQEIDFHMAYSDGDLDHADQGPTPDGDTSWAENWLEIAQVFCGGGIQPAVVRLLGSGEEE